MDRVRPQRQRKKNTLVDFRYETLNNNPTCYYFGLLHCVVTAVAKWLRCCATNRKVAGSIPAVVSGFFILPIFHPSDRTGVDSEMSNRRISWGKGGRCVRLTTYHHPVPLLRNLGTLTS